MPITPRLLGAGFPPLQIQGVIGTVKNGLIATTSTQIIYDEINVFTAVPSGGRCKLRADLGFGDSQLVVNLGANAISVFPPNSGTVNGGAVNGAYSVQPGCAVEFISLDTLDFITPGVGAGNAANSGSTFSLDMSGTTTTITVPGMLATSRFKWWPGLNSVGAAEMLPYLVPTVQVAGSITFQHPQPAVTCTYTYEVTV